MQKAIKDEKKFSYEKPNEEITARRYIGSILKT